MISNRIDFFKKYQPQAYSFVQASLQNSQGHAWLFYGPSSAKKREMALWMSEALLLEKNELFLYEELTEKEQQIVKRIEEGKYPDFRLLSGRRKTLISKEETDELQNAFSLKPKEGNRKVYIVDYCDNLSLAAANNMLKFLEEPTEETYAILTADHLPRLLNTIVSRCTLVPFYAIQENVRYENALQEGIDPEDAFLCSKMEDLPLEYGDYVVSEAYQNAKSMFKQTLNLNGDASLLLVDYEMRYKQKMTGEGRNKQARDANLDLLLVWVTLVYAFCKDVMKDTSVTSSAPSWYSKAVAHQQSNRNQLKKYSQVMKVLQETKDKMNRNNDLSLLLAFCVKQLEEVWE